MIRTLVTSILGITTGLALLAGASAPVSADDEGVTPRVTPVAEASTEAVQGVDPEAERDGRPVGYYIGRSADGGIHLRSHGPHARHHFTAVLRTDGTFVDVEGVRLERGDAVRVSDDGHTLRYDVYTFDGLDGVDFRVEGGEVLAFHLELNGRLIDTDRIYLGAADAHPAHNPFRIRL
ncbi:MAG: hypothetical protein IT299_06185 [Dehalococcoidia bacterium]|nr:hypothetical protein [Dehalococcoidia bacterium]